MARRNVTIKRIDPWSALKVGFLIHLSVLVVVLIASQVGLVVAEMFGVVEDVCNLASRTGLTEQDVADSCGLSRGLLFRNVLLLGLALVVVYTLATGLGAVVLNRILAMTGGLELETEEAGIAGNSAEFLQRPSPQAPVRRGGNERPSAQPVQGSGSAGSQQRGGTGGPTAASSGSATASSDGPSGGSQTVQDLVDRVQRSGEGSAMPIGKGEPVDRSGSSRENSLFGPKRN